MKCRGPLLIKNPAYKGRDLTIPVRCGKCEGCLKSKINDWAFRLEQEARRSLYVHFITLTYDPKHVPLTDTLLPTVSKSDVQKFMKRLRKNLKEDGKHVKYFIVAEYGTSSYRPHYHGIIFNVKEPEAYHKAWSIRRNDPIGHVHIGDSVTDGAIPYTLKYMYKKGLVPAFEGDDRTPEFRLMSNKLGANYLSPSIIKYHLADFKERQTVRTHNGINVALPRYYREKLIEIWGKPRSLLTEDRTHYMTSDDDDYRTLESRIANEKTQNSKFERTRNQQTRKKI